MVRTLDVAIIGLGTAGTALGVFLARAGHRVQVYERTPEPGTAGAGIIVQRTGLRVLAELGLKEQVISRGDRLSGLTVSHRSSRTLMDLRYAALGTDWFGLGLHRGALFEALWDALKHTSAQVLVGRTATALDTRSDGTYVHFSEHAPEGPFDLVAICDGSRSTLAQIHFPKRQSRTYPWGALWFVGAAESQENADILQQFVRRTDRMIGLLPTGIGPESGGGRPLVSLYYSIRSDRVAKFRDEFVRYRDEILELAPGAGALMSQIRGPEELIFTSYQDVSLFPYHRGSVVSLGDAAHAMSPQLGQGANLALYDAWVLSQCLEQASDIPSALARYSQNRRAHLGWYTLATRLLTPFFQGDSAWLARIRDASFPWLSRLPGTRGLMISAMAGASLGPLRGRVDC